MDESKLLERARLVTPGGAQTSSRRHGNVGPRSYPPFATRGEGAYLYFNDGTRAIDLAGSNGAAALGYAHPEVVASVERYIGSGCTLSLPTGLEVEASEAMIRGFDYDVAVRWVRTGSEAVSAAVSVALEATGREAVAALEGSYHGWHPWTRKVSRYESVDKVPLENVAALLIESPRWREVDNDYIVSLQRIRNLCNRHGALLIFDDVVYGFRFAVGGLTETTGVRSDLSCFSKALGNGVPVGCVVGSRDLMMRTGYRVSSTFGGETVGLAAARAVLALHAEFDVCGELREMGRRLRSDLDDGLRSSPIRVEGTPQHFRFVSDHPNTLERFLTLCMQQSGDARVLIHRDANNVNLMMNESIRQRIVDTVCAAASHI